MSVLSVVFILSLLHAAPPATLRLRAVGDVMMGAEEPAGSLPTDDGKALLDGVKPLLLDADLTFMNMEGPLCDSGETRKCKPGRPRATCYAFRTPTRYGQYLKDVGLDLASTANNHGGDYGESCRRSTERVLDQLGVTWSGPKGTVGTREWGGLKLALIAFHTSGSCNDVNDLTEAQKVVSEAKKTHALVIVSFHGGAEGTKATRVAKGTEKFLGENRGDLVAFTHGVIDAGADLVLGHGPHVLRALEVYKGHLIAYSLGNFATYGRFDLSGPLAVSVVLEAEISTADGTLTRGKVFSTRQEGKGVPVVDENSKGLKTLKDLSALDFPATGPKFSDDGSFAAK